ncbi:hypothetical protein AB0D49_34295 [Streptomyces sp. NPDC048290]|uniref:hypothetical protein n=1 Tax=Streptomyces sp. NPDC048290 TaxID=3155811 RepID=UPI0034465864
MGAGWSEAALLAVCTGLGLCCLALALRAAVFALRLRLRGTHATGTVRARPRPDPRPGGLVAFPDHGGRLQIVDPGAYAPLCGLPGVGASVPVVYPRTRPSAARLWNTAHLLAPSLGWFVSATLAFGLAIAVTP